MGDRGGRIGETPRLPDSPLAEAPVDVATPELQRWRARAIWVGGGLLTLFGLSLIAACAWVLGPVGRMRFGALAGPDTLVLALVFSGPGLLLGATLTCLLTGGSRWSTVARVAAVVAAGLLAATHLYMGFSAWSMPGSLTGSLLVADGGVFLVAGLGTRRLARLPAIVVAVIVVVWSLPMGYEGIGYSLRVGDPLVALLTGMGAGLPLIGALATAWLAATLPPAAEREAPDA